MKLYWIFPCYNEEDCLPFTEERILDKFVSLLKEGVIGEDSKLVFVDDGSKDKTWSIIEELQKRSPYVIGLKLSRNRGHQFAVEAGLRYSYEKKADATITMDVDLQDDIDVVKTMVEEFKNGFDIVYGVRNDRKTDSFFKKTTANAYYKLMRKMKVELIENAADFRLISYRAGMALLSYNEANLFLRGLVPQVGFPSTKVEYKRLAREKGYTHYPFSKMMKLALDGLTSFSDSLLRAIPKLGVGIILLSLLCALVFMILNLTGVLAPSIYYYLFPFIALNTGILLVCLGIVAIYLGRMNIEVRHRPHYFIDRIVGEEEEK